MVLTELPVHTFEPLHVSWGEICMFWRQITWPPELFKRKKTTKPSLLDYILLSTVGWGKKEIARARDKKQKRQIALKEKHVYFIAEVRK